jgi:hypothetical protein
LLWSSQFRDELDLNKQYAGHDPITHLDHVTSCTYKALAVANLPLPYQALEQDGEYSLSIGLQKLFSRETISQEHDQNEQNPLETYVSTVFSTRS